MNYGIEDMLPNPPSGCLGIHAAACHFNVSVELLREYACQGLLIPLISNRGVHHFTERDDIWIDTIGRLLHEAHLTFDGIRQHLAQYPCWQIRHCDFRSKGLCPLISDPSKPCWVNRARCSLLCSYPCYSCSVYRSAPNCDSFRALLSTSALPPPR
jgi:hypothetical protein